MKKSKKVLATGLILAALLLLCCGCSFMGNANGVTRFEMPADEDVEFIQMDPPAEGDRIGVVQTSLGTIKFRLFGIQSPKATENFVKLAEEKKFLDYQVYKVTTGRAFIASKKDGTGDSIYGAPFDNQYSAKLWNFPGAVGSISDEANKGDSRFYIVGHSTVSDEIFSQMKQNNFPDKVIEQYKLLGGCPELDWACNIFGQVFEGLDIVDKINAAETDEQGFPKNAITISSVTVETYHVTSASAAEASEEAA